MKGTSFTDNIGLINDSINNLIKVIEQIKNKQGPISANAISTLSTLIRVISTENVNCLITRDTESKNELNDIVNIQSYNMWSYTRIDCKESAKLNFRSMECSYVIYLTEDVLDILNKQELISDIQYNKFISDIPKVKKLISDLKNPKIEKSNLQLEIKPILNMKNSLVSSQKSIPDFTPVAQSTKTSTQLGNSEGEKNFLVSDEPTSKLYVKVTTETAKINFPIFELTFRKFNRIFHMEETFNEQCKKYIITNNDPDETNKLARPQSRFILFLHLIKFITLSIINDYNGFQVSEPDLSRLFGLAGNISNDYNERCLLRDLIADFNNLYGFAINIETLEYSKQEDRHFRITLTNEFIDELRKEKILSDEQCNLFNSNIRLQEKEDAAKEAFEKFKKNCNIDIDENTRKSFINAMVGTRDNTLILNSEYITGFLKDDIIKSALSDMGKNAKTEKSSSKSTSKKDKDKDIKDIIKKLEEHDKEINKLKAAQVSQSTPTQPARKQHKLNY